MSKFLVYGATGFAGGFILAELVARGHSVIAVSLHALTSNETPWDPHVRIVEGSILDLPQFESLAEGADGVVVAVPAMLFHGLGLTEAVLALLPEIAELGIHLIVVGGSGSLKHDNGVLVRDGLFFPAFVLPVAAEHFRALVALRDSGSTADWVSISPAETFGVLAPGTRTGDYRSQEGNNLLTDEKGVSSISGADFGIAVADELEHPQYHRTRFSVAY